MIDIIIRDCGHGEWLPIIVVPGGGIELYRGERCPSFQDAVDKAKSVWDNGETGNIFDFKEANGL